MGHRKACVLAVAAGLLLNSCGGEGTHRAAATGEANRADRSMRCDYPSVRPSYLPWDEDGAISAPATTYDEEIDRAHLVWTNPGDEGDSVALSVYRARAALSPEEPIGVTIEGAEGYLHEGSPGEHGAWWDLDDHCNLLELSMSLEGASPNLIDREVVKVAKSLE